MRAILALKEKMKDFERGRNNWVEPLRNWILDLKQANFLSTSNDFHEIKSFVQKIGTNPLVRDKSASFEIPVPSQFVAERRHLLPTPAPTARDFFHLSDSEVSICGGGGTRTHKPLRALVFPFQSGGCRTRTCKGFRPLVFKTSALPFGQPSALKRTTSFIRSNTRGNSLRPRCTLGRRDYATLRFSKTRFAR